MMPMSTDCMVGGIEGMEYHNHKAQLNVGDTLLMYTDGVNEAFNEQWEEYGDQRMQDLLEKLTDKNCQEIIAAQLENVRAFAGKAPQSDDITLMALKRKA